MTDLSSAWRPRYGLPANAPPIPRPEEGDVYFDLEFVQQTDSHAFGFDDKDQTLLTSIAGVVRNRDTYRSIYQVNGTDKAAEIATGGNGEKRIIFSFLAAVLAHLDSLSQSSTKLPRMFNFSGSGKAESRLPIRIAQLELRDLTQEEFRDAGLSFGGIQPGTTEWDAAWDQIDKVLDHQKIKDDDLNDAIKAHFGRFPNPPNPPNHGLKAIERFVPGLSGRGAVGSAIESKEVWRRIRSLRNGIAQTLADLPEDSVGMPNVLRKLSDDFKDRYRESESGNAELAPHLWDLVHPELLAPLGDPSGGSATAATAATAQSSSELSRFVHRLKCRSDRASARWATIGNWNKERLELEALYGLYATMDCVSLLRVHEYAEEVLNKKVITTETALGSAQYSLINQAIRAPFAP